jgi:hypothetical protein
MSNITVAEQSENLKIFKELLNSEEYKKYHEEKHNARLILARMIQILEEKNISQKVLAERMEMTPSGISRLLS